MIEEPTKEITPGPLSIGASEFLTDWDKMNNGGVGQSFFSLQHPLSPDNGGRLISIQELQAGDLILLTNVGSKAPGKLAMEGLPYLCLAGLLTNAETIVFPSNTGIESNKVDKVAGGSLRAVVLRRPHSSEIQTAHMVAAIEKERKMDKATQQFAQVRQLRVPVVNEICTLTPLQWQDRCQQFVGRIDLGTEDQQSFFAARWLIKTLSAMEGYLFTKNIDWSSEEEAIISREFNGRWQYLGHLK